MVCMVRSWVYSALVMCIVYPLSCGMISQLSLSLCFSSSILMTVMGTVVLSELTLGLAVTRVRDVVSVIGYGRVFLLFNTLGLMLGQNYIWYEEQYIIRPSIRPIRRRQK